MRHSSLIFAAIAAALGLAGCATMPQGFGGYGYNQRPFPNAASIYTPGESQQVQHVRLGTVIAVQRVQIDTATGRKLTGEGVGALAGGLLGHQIGGGNGKTLATVAGAFGGAVAGNAIAAHGYKQPGLQITVRLDQRAGTIAVTQNASTPIMVGERVEVIGSGYGDEPARVEPLPQQLAPVTQ